MSEPFEWCLKSAEKLTCLKKWKHTAAVSQGHNGKHANILCNCCHAPPCLSNTRVGQIKKVLPLKQLVFEICQPTANSRPWFAPMKKLWHLINPYDCHHQSTTACDNTLTWPNECLRIRMLLWFCRVVSLTQLRFFETENLLPCKCSNALLQFIVQFKTVVAFKAFQTYLKYWTLGGKWSVFLWNMNA